MASYFSEREVRLARSFLKAIKGNESNGYLLLAVIAWQRHMNKQGETFFKSLSKYSAKEAGIRLAKKLISRAGLDAKHFKGVLSSLRRTDDRASKQVTQARDFMLSLQLSAWTSTHYGYKAYKAGYWKTYSIPVHPYTATVWIPEQQEYDPLANTWQTLTGHTIPKAYFIDGTTTVTTNPKQPDPPPPPPRQPRALIHVQPTPDYIGPYAAARFYDQRKHLDHPDNFLPD